MKKSYYNFAVTFGLLLLGGFLIWYLFFPKNEWEYTLNVDPITDHVSSSALLRDHEYAAGGIEFSCRSNEPVLFTLKGDGAWISPTYPENTVHAVIRFDKEKPISVEMIDLNSMFLGLDEKTSQMVLTQMATADKMAIRVGGRSDYVFENLIGSAEVAKRVGDPCLAAPVVPEKVAKK